jgi:hypothetical protein
MQHSSRKLKDKIRTCGNITRTGGVIAAASLAVVSKTYGEPIRWQYNDHIPAFSGQGYDVDHDGRDDIYFDTSWSEGVLMQMLAWGNDTVVDVGSIIVNHADTYYPADMVVGHLFGDPIDLIDQGNTSGYLNHMDMEGPFFESTSPRYAGFYFFGPDSVAHNGWAELRVTEPMPFMFELDVIAIGYETEPVDVPIFAGQPLIAVAVEKSSWGRIKALYK